MTPCCLEITQAHEELREMRMRVRERSPECHIGRLGDHEVSGSIERLLKLHLCRDRIAKLQKKLSEARNRQSSIATRLESANNKFKIREVYSAGRTQDAFSRFDVLERRVDLAEGRAEALNLGGEPKTLEEEIAELKASEKVDAELEALKARLGKK